MDSDISSKTSGFGIGEAGQVPASTPLDDLASEEINATAEKSWAEHCYQEDGFCSENLSQEGYQPCGKRISRRVYFSHTMGCCANCEDHWIEYHSPHHPNVEKTFDALIADMNRQATEERKRVKHCAVCNSTAANWNPSAGSDLCEKHWDSY